MKIRKGFVSNSSSSSFICDLTGEVSDGYDCSLVECEMVGCENGHTFNYHGYPDFEAWVANTDDEEDSNEDSDYNMPSRLCPICNGEAKAVVATRMKAELKRLNLTAEDVR